MRTGSWQRTSRQEVLRSWTTSGLILSRSADSSIVRNTDCDGESCSSAAISAAVFEASVVTIGLPCARIPHTSIRHTAEQCASHEDTIVPELAPYGPRLRHAHAP